jgi:hypothetical protein
MEAGRPHRALRPQDQEEVIGRATKRTPAAPGAGCKLGRVLINAQIAAACATDLHDAQASAVLDHSRTLPQGDGPQPIRSASSGKPRNAPAGKSPRSTRTMASAALKAETSGQHSMPCTKPLPFPAAQAVALHRAGDAKWHRPCY